MGQRHQIYLRTYNPVVKEIQRIEKELSGKPDKIKEWKKAQKELRKYVKQLGKDEKTILAFHHQWLYGQMAPANAYQVLTFSKEAEDYSNPFDKNYDNLRHNLSPIQDLIDFVTNLMCIQNNEISKMAGRIGIERFSYLNDDDFAIRENFTRGDNNDGITIIDTTTNKYCFISFEGIESEYRLIPLFVPLSAKQYVNAYYPIEESKLSDYTKEKRCNNDKEQVQAKLRENKAISDLVEKKMSEFEVMTLEEVKAMFPKVYENLPAYQIGKIPED